MTSMVLPPRLTDIGQFRKLRADPSLWLPMARDIASSHGYAGIDLSVFATGTNLVVGIGDRLILKIFPPMLRSQFISERGALGTLAGRLRLDSPEIVHEGEREQWLYLIITRLSGVLASDVWADMAEADAESVLRQLGGVIADVQRVPPGDLLQIEPDWAGFLQRQIAGCRARQQRLGLHEKFLAGLDDLLRDAREMVPTDAPPVILTGEYIPENFLLTQDNRGWTVSGLFDFGDVLTGWGEYDLLGPSAFMAAGKAGRVRSLFEGYGYETAEIDGRLKRRLLALMLLHRASDPNRHICIDGWQSKVDTLEDLQELIWPS